MAEYPGEERIDIASYKENSVGKNFSASKVEYIFEFLINGKSNELKLVKSVVSGKLRIFLNQNLIHFEQKFFGENFRFEYNVGDVRMAIVQKGSKFDLTVMRKLPARVQGYEYGPARGGAPVGYVPPYAIQAQTPTAIRSPGSGHNGFPLQPHRIQPPVIPNDLQFQPVPVATPGANPLPRYGGTFAQYVEDSPGVEQRPGFGFPEQSPHKHRPAQLSRTNSDEFFSERELFFYKTYY